MSMEFCAFLWQLIAEFKGSYDETHAVLGFSRTFKRRLKTFGLLCSLCNIQFFRSKQLINKEYISWLQGIFFI